MEKPPEAEISADYFNPEILKEINPEVLALLNKQNVEVRSIINQDMMDLDKDSIEHILRTANTAYIIANKLNLPPADVKNITEGAIYHDLGKVLTPSSILKSASKLTPEQSEIMHHHAEYSYKFAQKHTTHEIAEIAGGVHAHGKNPYPKNFKFSGNNEKNLSDILSLVDIYDAILNKRSYKDKKEFSNYESFENEFRIARGELSKENIFIIETLYEYYKEAKKIKKWQPAYQ